MTNNDEINRQREAFEKWRLSKDGIVVYEWEGKPKKLPLIVRDSCFNRGADYQNAKNAPVTWFNSGHWVFEKLQEEDNEKKKLPAA